MKKRYRLSIVGSQSEVAEISLALHTKVAIVLPTCLKLYLFLPATVSVSSPPPALLSNTFFREEISDEEPVPSQTTWAQGEVGERALEKDVPDRLQALDLDGVAAASLRKCVTRRGLPELGTVYRGWCHDLIKQA